MKNLAFDFAPKKPPDEPKPLTVAELDRALKEGVESLFERPVWIEGEVSGARPNAAGHLYFTLKDEEEDASIDAVIYRTNVTPRVRALVRDGARVRLRGKPTVWAPRGRLQFVADRSQPAGQGAILEALERLKEKLHGEGLFAPEKKRPLPLDPRRIGVVTSPTGAVIHDICRVAFRRGGARILLSAAAVQGERASGSIVSALSLLQEVTDVDVIVIGRGGGSADELAVFNDEAVVRAVAACRVPIVSAVGHEVDVTLTDFAADVRAATPSQAAELVVPNRAERGRLLGEARARILRAMGHEVVVAKAALDRAVAGLADPRALIASRQQSLDDLRSRLALVHPRSILERRREAFARLDLRLRELVRASVLERRGRLAREIARLDAMSPLKVLGRGYAIATREDGRAVRTIEDAKPGDRIRVRAEQAILDAMVVTVEVPS